MNDVLKSIGRGFAGLVRFRGRDSRARFWHYAGFVIVVTQIAGLAAMMPTIARIQRYALEHPDQASISTGPGHYSVQISGRAPELGPVMERLFSAVSVLAVITVLLLAAAVARRLHDRDRRGYWGLAPLPFLAAAMVLMPKVMADFGGEEPNMRLFFALLGNNLAYLYALALLVYLLVGKGTPGPNRFGPPPD
jgi:uncharacterized membrane protein YhaH (DUF805 family)